MMRLQESVGNAGKNILKLKHPRDWIKCFTTSLIDSRSLTESCKFLPFSFDPCITYFFSRSIDNVTVYVWVTFPPI